MKITKNLYKKFSSSSTTTFDMPEYFLKYNSLLKKSNIYVEEIFPKKINNTSEFIEYFNIKQISPNVSIECIESVKSVNEGLFDPCWDILESGGKKWRPIFGLIIAKYFKLDIEDVEKNKLLYKLTAIPELLHNASLILDDIEDKSETRRGKPCTYIKYGDDFAINAGCSMLFLVYYKLLQSLNDTQKLQSVQSYMEEVVALHIGQTWDIEMSSRRIPLTSNYIDKVIFKTGVMPRLIVKLIKILFDNDKESELIFREFLDIADFLSVAFQIKDDLLNITSNNLSKSKTYIGEDIYSGKLTLMVLHSLNSSNPSKIRLQQILSMKTKEDFLINEAIQIMENNGSIKYANEIMKKYTDLVYEKSNNLAKQDSKLFDVKATNEIISLAEYLINRNI